jgi:hypothetical protein
MRPLVSFLVAAGLLLPGWSDSIAETIQARHESGDCRDRKIQAAD